MKLHYSPDTDSLYIDLKHVPGVDSRELADGVVPDFDEQGHIVGLDIQEASNRLDLSTLETDSLPAVKLKIA